MVVGSSASKPPLARAAHRMMLTGRVVPGGILMVVGRLNMLGRRRPKALVDENGRALRGCVPEKAFADINGVRQGNVHPEH